jgi:hypothetical protein
MAHYAFLDSNNIVTNVIVGHDESNTQHNWETYYGNIIGQTCKRTSYNTSAGIHLNEGTPFRKNYAGIGYKYHPSHDGFSPPKFYASWTLNTTTLLWYCPVDYPTNVEDSDGNPIFYSWNEANQEWDITS